MSTPQEFNSKKEITIGFVYWLVSLTAIAVFSGTTWYWNSNKTTEDLELLRKEIMVEHEAIRKEIKEIKISHEEDIDYFNGRLDRKVNSLQEKINSSSGR